MKPALIPSLLVAALLAGASTLHAQVTLETFSSFESADTLFYGDWSNSGDPFAGDPTPVATFSQGAGFYNFASVSNADSSFVEHAFAAPLNLAANDLLTLSLRLIADNTADSLTVFLIDAGLNTAFATFQTSGFNAAAFTQGTIAFTADAGFDPSAVSSFRISGNDPFTGGTLSVAIDDLSVTSSRSITAVPEPAAYGSIGALVLLALLGIRRFRN
jgi:hypothetical protein